MKWILAGVVFIATAAVCSLSLGYEPSQPTEVNIEKLSRRAEAPESLKDFFKDRTHFEVGFDESFNDNVLLQDNNKRDDYISALEGRVLFADPRGSLLYGGSYIVDLFRYHRANANAIDHRPELFFDLDTGGRVRYQLDYELSAINHLVFGPEGIDILRRSSDFQRTVTHEWHGKVRYALNDTNALVPQMEYFLFDDQTADDANTDRRSLKAILDLDHDLRPGWVLFGGYEFSDVTITGNKVKNSEGHAARLGCRYALTEVADLDVVLKFDHRKWQSGQQRNDVGVKGIWDYEVGPRTKLSLEYTDERIPSFAADRLQFRSMKPAMKVLYELTPLTDVILEAAYERQRSDGRDVLAGSPITSVVSSHYTFKARAKWHIREQVHLDLDYIFDRSRTRDTTNHSVRIGIKVQL